MSSIPVVTKPVLVYDRISQNHRRTIVLVALAIALTIPFIGAVSFGATEAILWRFAPSTRISRAGETHLREAMARYQPEAGEDPEGYREFQREMESQLRKMQEARESAMARAARLRLETMIVTSLATTALLGLLFWSIASSPTSKILGMCGARPAGTTASEAEAKRLLENLAIGAGLPTPKLYVIDTPLPNAFAAGPSPEHAVVAVTQGLLLLMEKREVEAVLAHELSHIGNRDTRLNTVVASLTLFLRLPYLLLKQRIQNGSGPSVDYNPMRSRGWYRIGFTLAMIPAIIYVFIVAPILAALIRAAVSRGREFLADADAMLLTRNPEGIMHALAKIGGAGSMVSGSNPAISHFYFANPVGAGSATALFSGNLLATHPPIDKRIAGIMEFHGGAVAVPEIEAAIHRGAEYGRLHKASADTLPKSAKQNELSVLNAGNPMGRVFRVLTPTPLYDQPDLKSGVLARIPADALVVVFDDPGKFRQVVTHDQTFGYMPVAVKLQRVDMLPEEIHDPKARAAALQAVGQAAAAAAASASPALSGKQLAIVAVVSLAVFAGIFLVMIKLGS